MFVRHSLDRRRSPSSLILNLGASLKRVLEIRFPTVIESLSVDMLTSSYLPYEASRTYRAIMTEFDCRRTQSLVDARRLLMHVP
jgi:hypothetical protein